MLVIDCALVEPAWGCRHRIRATTEAEALRLAAMHARFHGDTPTPALLARSRALLREEDAPPPRSQPDPAAVVRPHPRCLVKRAGLRRRSRSATRRFKSWTEL